MQYYNNDINDKSSGRDEELERIMQRKMNEFSLQANKNTNTMSGQASVTSPITLTDNNFKGMVDKHPLLIVDFWAPWCGPCRLVSPIISELSKELAGKAVFGKLNVDENPMIATTFGIQSIPTIAIFKNGKAVDGIIGAASKSQILSKLSSYIDRSNSKPGFYQ